MRIARPDGERRQLTVLFCDLVGSPSLSQQLDAESGATSSRSTSSARAIPIRPRAT